MKEFLERHKIKIAHGLSLFLLVIFAAGAAYLLSRGGRSVQNAGVRAEDTALSPRFANLDIKAKAYAVYDGTLGRIIFGKNESAQLPLASLAKVMSAIVALQTADRNDTIDVLPSDKFDVADDKYLPVPGKWRLGDILRFTLVASSNTGIDIIADRISSKNHFLGGRNYFIEMMNKEAAKLGLKQTYFLNASGLDISQNLSGAYGSPQDVATFFDYAIKNYPDIFEATRYGSITINSLDGKTLTAPNTNQTVSQFENLVASKTGLTDLADGNLVVALDASGGRNLIIAVMGSTASDRFSDVETLAKAVPSYYYSSAKR